ncbi:hypothetical protein GRX01_10690 [Halobaculum sp. WSA2]|uniref:Uncharacterized protein n=1 Tax=Halobaculum saliterrae TaxID=2073113 RepID=A0A6B0T0N0_9EURY|nr:FxLYD domain-containing protein [Halobaculum saliterrae]MXR41800.1 hypothetical protein [Halobaculum saliterrae]
MNRRTLIRTTGIASAGIGLAGCSGAPDAGADTTEPTDDVASVAPDVSLTVVRNASENPEPYEDPAGTVVPQESDALALDEVIFQRAGERGIVVSGNLSNTADRPFVHVAVEVILYDENETEDGLLDSATLRTTHGRLDAGNYWAWATTFGEPEFEVDYYSVEATARYD